MLESKNVKVIGEIPIVDREWKAMHQIGAHTLLDDSPPFRGFKNLGYRSICFIKKLNAEGCDRGLVVSRRFD